MDQQRIDYLKKTYPEIITKDQFYRICHVSKRTATYLLDNGFVPCTNSGKKTRKYKMRLDDVITFLEQRENNPLMFKAPNDYYKDNKGKNFSYAYSLNTKRLLHYRKMLRAFLEKHLANCNDVLTPIDIEGILGYSYKSVTRWCVNKELRAFLIKNKFQIPKEYLIDFMITERCILIAKKSDKHIEMMTEALQYINSQFSKNYKNQHSE